MKLVDLDPMWMQADGRERMGFIFQCPLCRETSGHYVCVYFANPVDDGPPASDKYDPSPRWRREGTEFADLTTHPSIHIVGGCGWHGFVTAGLVRSV